MPLEIDEKVVNILKDDDALTSYTGADVNDSRIYSWNPNLNVTFGDGKNGAILYRDSQSPDPLNESYPTQRGNVNYYFSIKSPSKTLAKRIGERIENIFRRLEIRTDNYRVGIVTINGNTEGVAEGSITRPVYTRNVNLLLKNVFKTNEF